MVTEGVTLYDTRGRTVGSTVFPAPEIIDLVVFEADLRRAIYRFWLSERRMPAAIIVPLQLARNIAEFAIQPFVGDLYTAGYFDDIPVLAREAYIDPLFLLI